MVLTAIVYRLPEGETRERANVDGDTTQGSEWDVLNIAIISVTKKGTHIFEAKEPRASISTSMNEDLVA